MRNVEVDTFDLIVVGGGIAGLTSATRAAELGLKVAIIERGMGSRYLCNSRYSGGIIHVAFCDVKDKPSVLLDAILKQTNGKADPQLANALAHNAARSVDWLRNKGVQFIKVGDIAWRQWVIAPPRRIAPGQDWMGRGPDVMLRCILKNFISLGGVIYNGFEAISLLEKNTQCVGIKIKKASDVLTLLSKSVVLADGGFQGNTALLKKYITPEPTKVMQRGASTGVGDGLRMATEIGGHQTKLGYFYGHTLCRDAFNNDKTWPFPQIDELCCAGIVIDQNGRRLVDEGLGGVTIANAIAKLADPLSTWVIFDELMWLEAGCLGVVPVNPHLIHAHGTIVKAHTLIDLAEKIGVNYVNLFQTIEEYDEAVKSGNGSHLAISRTTQTKKAYVFTQSPFYAIPLCAGLTYTFGGIAIDEHARVIKADGAPIGGLYAAGTTAGGIEGVDGCGYVGGLIMGLVFGMRAAEHVADTI